MNKNAIQKFAIWARNELIAQVSQRAYQYGIDEFGFGDASADTLNGRLLTAEEKSQRQELIKQIKEKGYQQVMEEVAYTWFNRFIALRFMEVNNYLPSHIRVFSDASGAFKPEILNDVLHLDLPGLDSGKVAEYIESNDTEALYRYLLLTQCNALNSALPVMFERMGGYTEMLLPNNILRQDSVLGHMVSDIPEEDWQDAVQIIGWLYQYYNTELKDDTFAQLKKNVKITKERIPAATQLFTPDWIVRYMVENSLGRLWLEGHPNAELHDGWKYYLDEAKQEPDVEDQLAKLREEYKTIKPEEIKVIDPCCGSGHILAYLFDVLMQIYENYGYTPRDAVTSILQNNLYGLDIDDRAAQLAYFAVMMKARRYDRRFFSHTTQPHVYAIEESNRIEKPDVEYFCNSKPELKDAMHTILTQLYDAKEYGSILTIPPQDWDALYARFDEVADESSFHRESIRKKLLPLVRVAQTLAQKYDVVVTNPPYMGASNMNSDLSEYVKKYYPDSKSDLFAVFIEVCSRMAKQNGYQAMITQHAWMFLSSFAKLREKMMLTETVSMTHLGARAFEEIGGEVVQTTAFVRCANYVEGYKGIYCRLIEPTSQQGKEDMFLAGENRYTVNQEDFGKIPGNGVIYWGSQQLISDFERMPKLGDLYRTLAGSSTGDNSRFLRIWQEVDSRTIGFHISKNYDGKGYKWIPTLKGGGFQRWYGNFDYVMNWNNDGEEIKYWVTHNPKDPNTKSWSRRLFNTDLYFHEGITWSKITTGRFSARYMPEGFIMESASCGIMPSLKEQPIVLAILNSKVAQRIIDMFNPTVNIQVGDIMNIPMSADIHDDNIEILVDRNIKNVASDWNSFETSWDFKKHPLLRNVSTISEAFNQWQAECDDRFNRLKANEEELNRIFIDIYGLQDELTPEVEDKDVTVRKADLGRDVRSFISYAVGCMFGRYSPTYDGLAYAGGTWDDGKYNIYKPDADGIIPICDDEYFEDDMMGRFVEFVRVVYGDSSLEDNLRFIANALGGKGQPKEVIRNYFLNDFYADHCKIYQKRPIYWLFDSGKKNGFKCQIYLHRYQPDTIARIRTDYVHEQQARYRTAIEGLEKQVAAATSTSERVKLTKQLNKVQAQDAELHQYEEKVHALADQMIKIDLDDGVKHNYEIFKDVLAKIK